VVAFSGENLGATTLLKVYLTDGKHDFQIVFAEQTSMSMKFRIPEKVHAGRFAFMALTAGDDGRFVELPRFRVTIDQYGAFQVQDTEKATRATCAAVYRNTADKKVSDLTVKEGQQVRACQAVGLYPPQ
jgi:hypothetical protein